ncbi:cell division cycle- protein [Nowakowskiella sp. JEL0078]|nr:cell division cycle- protein [Nowakowskiella sp. JEL0078]
MPRLQSAPCANKTAATNHHSFPFELSPMNLCSEKDLMFNSGNPDHKKDSSASRIPVPRFSNKYSNASRWTKRPPIPYSNPLSKSIEISNLQDHIFNFQSPKCNSPTSMVDKHEPTSHIISRSQSKSTSLRKGILKHTISTMEIDVDLLETETVTDGRSLRKKPSSIMSVKSPVFDFEEPLPRKPPAKMRRTVSDFELKKTPHMDLDTSSKRHSIAAPLRSLSTSMSDTQYLLPCMDAGKDAIKRINGETLSNLLNGVYSDRITEYHIIDCRFPYEYNGGHISTSKNVNTMKELENMFFSPSSTNTNVVLIFTCEFSSQRGPRMALHVRDVDRKLNYDNYPALYYPNLYVLQGGYREFFSKQKIHCVPQKYVEMSDESYRAELKLMMSRHRREFGKSKSLSDIKMMTSSDDESF